jgi:hypothetical protein
MQSLTLPPLDLIDAELARRGELHVCLWPAPYNEDTAEAAWAFLLQCRSYLETEGQVRPIPPAEFLKAYVYLWHEVKANPVNNMLFTQKCRRMMISWCARALELHQMGLGRCDQYLVGEDLEAASKHVWRLKHLYTDLQKRFPEWKLPDHKELRYEGERKLKMFGLPNGSVCNYGNGEAGSFQGEGCQLITMEEPALYSYLADMVAQAKILTMGPSQSRTGTLVNLIANTPTMDSNSAYSFGQLKANWEKIPARG